ncbi:MAG: T9SS type A sorting domain-containing protein [Bacteroidales bacterium]|nr:T9SS type A sorting domain-containing protein [Bacteroidales bacterium]
MFSVSTLLNEVKELNKPSVVVVSNTYPNPSHGDTRFDLNLEKSFNVAYSITSISGQQMISSNLGQMSAGRHTLQIDNNLASGIYFLNVKVGEKTYTSKLIVE